jgi:GTP-binding protein EngB required for normal cell division
MNKLEETIGLLQELDAAKVPGYGASKIPDEIDEKITRTLKSYLELNE